MFTVYFKIINSKKFIISFVKLLKVGSLIFCVLQIDLYIKEYICVLRKFKSKDFKLLLVKFVAIIWALLLMIISKFELAELLMLKFIILKIEFLSFSHSKYFTWDRSNRKFVIWANFVSNLKFSWLINKLFNFREFDIKGMVSLMQLLNISRYLSSSCLSIILWFTKTSSKSTEMLEISNHLRIAFIFNIIYLFSL